MIYRRWGESWFTFWRLFCGMYRARQLITFQEHIQFVLARAVFISPTADRSMFRKSLIWTENAGKAFSIQISNYNSSYLTAFCASNCSILISVLIRLTKLLGCNRSVAWEENILFLYISAQDAGSKQSLCAHLSICQKIAPFFDVFWKQGSVCGFGFQRLTTLFPV